MDRFRELVSKLNVGDLSIGDLSRARTPSPQPPAPDVVARQREILDELPATKAFIDSLPRHVISKTAAENDKKAAEAILLIGRVDELIRSHVTAAHDLRKYVEELSNVKIHLSAAHDQAYSLHQQLVEIDREINQVETAASQVDLDRLQQTEDAIFEAYAKQRRAELNQKKQEYEDKLASFQRDRYVVSKDFGQRSTSQPRLPSKASASQPVVTRSQSKGKEIEVRLDHGETHQSGLDAFLGVDEPSGSRPAVSSAQEKLKEFVGKKGKGKKPANRLQIPAKAAPARPKIDIMADEDFSD
ncbi:hypothetical protein Dda_6832 [Drechslerella dactyloides]|uniref:Uncharacterized protein n=1 Tax=Drechslerella dactyloides TaxID=74499 RepID=A0AAD6IU73_DREDA|nr:hypothetical protein Dda_6832 [Drechslerella dactyloides]